MAFSGRASHHQCAHGHETRPPAPHESGERRDRTADAGQHVLIEQEKRLDRADLAASIPCDEIAIVESLLDGVFDQLVIAMVFALAREGLGPMRITLKLVTRGDVHAAAPMRRGRLFLQTKMLQASPQKKER